MCASRHAILHARGARRRSAILEHATDDASHVLGSALDKIGQASHLGIVTPWRDQGRSWGAGRRAQGADFAHGRWAWGAGQRPPAPLPTLGGAAGQVSQGGSPPLAILAGLPISVPDGDWVVGQVGGTGCWWGWRGGQGGVTWGWGCWGKTGWGWLARPGKGWVAGSGGGKGRAGWVGGWAGVGRLVGTFT